MAEDGLFPADDVHTAAPLVGGAAAALEAALEDGELVREYPVGVALARAVMRAVDVADRERKASVMAQLVKPAVEVLRPLGLMPADVEAVQGRGVTGGGGEGARVLSIAGTATVAHTA